MRNSHTNRISWVVTHAAVSHESSLLPRPHTCALYDGRWYEWSGATGSQGAQVLWNGKKCHPRIARTGCGCLVRENVSMYVYYVWRAPGRAMTCELSLLVSIVVWESMGPREVLAASFLSSLGEFVTRVSLPTRCATQTHVVMITLCIHSGHSSGSGRLSFLAICTKSIIIHE